MTIPQEPPEQIPPPEEPGTEIPPEGPTPDLPPTEYPETKEPGYRAPGTEDEPRDLPRENRLAREFARAGRASALLLLRFVCLAALLVDCARRMLLCLAFIHAAVMVVLLD